LRFSRDKRGYENTFVVHPEKRKGKGRTRILYWFRTPPGVKVGRSALDEDAIRLIEEQHPNIDVLGSHEADRLSIVSFVIRHGQQFLHHNFVVALLNDVFGIQSRGGCSCAGPYGHRLLGIDLDRSHEFQREISRGCEGIKPGWVRVNFNYFIDDATFTYIVEAVQQIASHGGALLDEYCFDPDTGIWSHRVGSSGPSMRLDEISYTSGSMGFENRRRTHSIDLGRHLADAESLFLAAGNNAAAGFPRFERPQTNPDFEHLRWFAYPGEATTERRNVTKPSHSG